MAWWNETIRAIATLLDAVAWPILAGTAICIFKEEVASLLKRIRKGAGIEVDPIHQPTEPSDEILPPNPASGAQRLFPQTKASEEWEDIIRKFPPIESAPDPTQKENLLIELAARAILIASFEQVEGIIWRSQIELLTHLKQFTAGATLADLQDRFYTPASERYPRLFSSYPYDRYLNFLGSFSLITSLDDRARITDKGMEYLDWRIYVKKHEKAIG